ncbi:hypothetical protein [Kineosporia sp. NBRC 101731]|uniref:hypothetical protein n=1 Tax=Kineosporia sp. NBRC 101731 TaxID=3032199 RepID=UPI0024A0FE17|nr:hypothetical protein [Kineosporia sp. NBRC 101731]GLY33109.1 hypothetical protein Kisp02_64740 [Kineosporia sp. NBRC 101731]
MSRTEEISSEVKAVNEAATEAGTRADEILEYAREQIEISVEHGWDGVGQSINIAGEALEKIAAELSGLDDAFESAASTLDEITEQMSRSEVAQHLSLSLTALEGTQETLENTVSLVDEAMQGAEQAEHEALANRLQLLRENVEGLFERLAQSRSDIEAEHEEAQNMGQGEGDETQRDQKPDQDRDRDGRDGRDQDDDQNEGRAPGN